MALDARHRSSIYSKLIPLLGEDDANAFMTEFPSLEADELVTKQFLRAEIAELRTDLIDRMHRQSALVVGTIIAATAAMDALRSIV